MTRKPNLGAWLLVTGLMAAGCIRYSFSGSTLPAHLKSVEIPLVENSSPRLGLEERLRESVYNAFTAVNQLRVTENGGDAELKMKILSYSNMPDEYDVSGNVKTYRSVVTVEVMFRDIKDNEVLYENKVVGTGVYNHLTDQEETGVDLALKRVSEIIINNTISGW